MNKHSTSNAGWNKMVAKDRQQLVSVMKQKVTELSTAVQIHA